MNDLVFDTAVIRSTLAGIKAGKKMIIQQGGTNSGKTYGVLLALYLFAVSAQERKLISVVGCTMPHLRRGAVRQFNDICEKMGQEVNVNKTNLTYDFQNCTIEFFSADDNDKVRGSKRDILFVNEANLINYERYRQLAIRTEQVEIIDFNPTSEFWLHEKILPHRDNFLYKITTYKDNPTVSQKIIDDIERLKHTDPQAYRVYAEGKTGQIEGLVFDNAKIAEVWPLLKRRAYGLDFGYSNDPTALVEVGLAFGEIYAREIIYETGLIVPDISKRMEEMGVRRIDEIFADAADPASIEQLRRSGWNIRAAKKGKGSIMLGIDLIKSHGLNIHKNSVNLIKERLNYKWKQDRDMNLINTPIDSWNHGMDAIRYYCISKLKRGRSFVNFANQTA